MMERQVNQMVRLVDDLLDVSRITTGKLAIHKSVTELQATLRDAVETVRPFVDARRHELVLEIPPELRSRWRATARGSPRFFPTSSTTRRNTPILAGVSCCPSPGKGERR